MIEGTSHSKRMLYDSCSALEGTGTLVDWV